MLIYFWYSPFPPLLFHAANNAIKMYSDSPCPMSVKRSKKGRCVLNVEKELSWETVCSFKVLGNNPQNGSFNYSEVSP